MTAWTVWSWGQTRRSYWTTITLRRRRGEKASRGWTSGGSEPGDGAIWLTRQPLGPIVVSTMRALR